MVKSYDSIGTNIKPSEGDLTFLLSKNILINFF